MISSVTPSNRKCRSEGRPRYLHKSS